MLAEQRGDGANQNSTEVSQEYNWKGCRKVDKGAWQMAEETHYCASINNH